MNRRTWKRDLAELILTLASIVVLVIGIVLFLNHLWKLR
jgi:hypothetical protein